MSTSIILSAHLKTRPENNLLNDRIFHRVSVQLNANIARWNHANVSRRTLYSDLLGKKYSIPPRGMVLKGSLQLDNMWRSDHLSRKRTPAGVTRKTEEEQRQSLASRSSLCLLLRARDEISHYAWLDLTF